MSNDSYGLREHALGLLGGSSHVFHNFRLSGYAGTPHVSDFWHELRNLSPYERRMLALFIAEMVEEE